MKNIAKVNIASVDILGATTGSFVDGSDDNIKNTGTYLFGFLTFSEGHDYIKYDSI